MTCDVDFHVLCPGVPVLSRGVAVTAMRLTHHLHPTYSPPSTHLHTTYHTPTHHLPHTLLTTYTQPTHHLPHTYYHRPRHLHTATMSCASPPRAAVGRAAGEGAGRAEPGDDAERDAFAAVRRGDVSARSLRSDGDDDWHGGGGSSRHGLRRRQRGGRAARLLVRVCCRSGCADVEHRSSAVTDRQSVPSRRDGARERCGTCVPWVHAVSSRATRTACLSPSRRCAAPTPTRAAALPPAA